MKIGIGLPNPVPGTPGTRLVEWAKRAEDRGFSGLATIDRLAYPSYDSLATLAAAAGATTRIELLTNVLLAPLYPAPLLAKTAASIDQLSDGRLTLGLAPGGRGVLCGRARQRRHGRTQAGPPSRGRKQLCRLCPRPRWQQDLRLLRQGQIAAARRR